MRAFKFTRTGGVAPFTEVVWRPGVWVDAVEFPDRGVHALRAEHLPYWLGEELWEVDLSEPIVERPTQLVASRGRLVREVVAWNADTRAALLDDLVERATHRLARADAGFVDPGGLGMSAPDRFAIRRDVARAIDLDALDARQRALVGCYCSVLGAALKGFVPAAAFIASSLAAIEATGPEPSDALRAAAAEAARTERTAQAASLGQALGLASA